MTCTRIFIPVDKGHAEICEREAGHDPNRGHLCWCGLVWYLKSEVDDGS